MKVENTKAQMRKGILEYCILTVLSKREAYPSDIIQELKEAKLIVVEGTLYPLLHRLEAKGLLRSDREPSVRGKQRKVYRITRKGRTRLESAQAEWMDLKKLINRILGESWEPA